MPLLLIKIRAQYGLRRFAEVAILLYAVGIYPEWGGAKRFMAFAGALLLAYKAPDLFIDNKIAKRSAAIRKGLPDALDLGCEATEDHDYLAVDLPDPDAEELEVRDTELLKVEKPKA